MRAIGGILAGLIAAVAAIMAVGLVGGLFFSVEVPTDPIQNAEATAAALGAAPLGAQILLILSWLVGGFAGLAAAKWVARVSWPGWVIAGGLALLLATTFLAPLPVWMQVLAVIGPLIGGLLADMLVRGGAEEPAADARA
jgi:hypothetical protein